MTGALESHDAVRDGHQYCDRCHLLLEEPSVVEVGPVRVHDSCSASFETTRRTRGSSVEAVMRSIRPAMRDGVSRPVPMARHVATCAGTTLSFFVVLFVLAFLAFLIFAGEHGLALVTQASVMVAGSFALLLGLVSASDRALEFHPKWLLLVQPESREPQVVPVGVCVHCALPLRGLPSIDTPHGERHESCIVAAAQNPPAPPATRKEVWQQRGALAAELLTVATWTWVALFAVLAFGTMFVLDASKPVEMYGRVVDVPWRWVLAAATLGTGVVATFLMFEPGRRRR